MKYYDLKRNWTKRVMPHLDDSELNRVLKHDFERFIFGRWSMRFEPGSFPLDYESCDWWCEHRGPMPRYWRYVKHSACHWLVNFNLRLALLVDPDRPWRIVSSNMHSTVWDGEETLFDINFYSLGIPADTAWALACLKAEVYDPGEYHVVHYTEHFSRDLAGEYGDKWQNEALAEGPDAPASQLHGRIVR